MDALTYKPSTTGREARIQSAEMLSGSNPSTRVHMALRSLHLPRWSHLGHSISRRPGSGSLLQRTTRIRRRRTGMERSDIACRSQPEGQRRGALAIVDASTDAIQAVARTRFVLGLSLGGRCVVMISTHRVRMKCKWLLRVMWQALDDDLVRNEVPPDSQTNTATRSGEHRMLHDPRNDTCHLELQAPC